MREIAPYTVVSLDSPPWLRLIDRNCMRPSAWELTRPRMLPIATFADRCMRLASSFAASVARRTVAMEASLRVFGVLPSGQRVDAVTLRNAAGMSVELATYGATVTSVKVPGKDRPAEVGVSVKRQNREREGGGRGSVDCHTCCVGAVQEVTLCYRDLAGLLSGTSYYGCTVGRVANRIAKGRFDVDGKVTARCVRASVRVRQAPCHFPPPPFPRL